MRGSQLRSFFTIRRAWVVTKCHSWLHTVIYTLLRTRRPPSAAATRASQRGGAWPRRSPTRNTPPEPLSSLASRTSAFSRLLARSCLLRDALRASRHGAGQYRCVSLSGRALQRCCGMGGLYLRSKRAATRRAEGWGGGGERRLQAAAAARGASANDGQYTITTTGC